MKRETLLWLGVVLVIAAALRLPHITQPLVDAFSWREASTAMMADNFGPGRWNIFYPDVSWVGPEPGYQGRELPLQAFITALLNHAFGWRDWSGRAVSVSFGLFGVVVFFFLTRRTLGPRRGLFAALMLALLPGAAFIDRAYLPDPVMLALTLSGLLLLVLYAQTRRLLLLYGAAIVLALGLLAKLSGLPILAPAAYVLYEAGRRRTWTRAERLHLAAAAALFAAPIVAYYCWAVYLGTHTPPYHVAGVGYVWQDPAEFFRQRFYISELRTQMSQRFAGPAIILLTAAGLFVRPQTDASETVAFRLPWLFEVWLAASAVFFAIAAREFANNPWNLMFVAPPVAGLAGRALAALVGEVAPLPRRLREARPLFLLGVVTAVLFVLAAGIVKERREPYSDNDRAMGMRLAELSAPGDLVVTAAVDIGNPIAIYYSRRRGWVFPPGGLCPPGGAAPESNWTLLEDDARAIARLDTLRAAGADWFGLNKGATDARGVRLVEASPRLLAHLEAASSYVEDQPHFRIYRLTALEGPPPPALPCPHAPR
jgi:4-amino-4-deoxy-L-arabinose transferase-like glycosyltransferase